MAIGTDGAFVHQTGDAGVGAIARDANGVVIFSAWRVLFDCANAAEAEARACVEGLRLASQWVQAPIILQSDCSRVVASLTSIKEDRSEIGFLIQEAKELMAIMPQVKVQKVRREQNIISHELANLARRDVHTAVWLRQVPACIVRLVEQDCNSLS